MRDLLHFTRENKTSNTETRRKNVGATEGARERTERNKNETGPHIKL